MSNTGISNATYVSSISNASVGGASATDIMSYVETLLVQEYDSQMKDMATSIKLNNRIKEAVRNYKTKINELLNKTQKDGKVELSQSEYDILNYQPDFRWDSEMYNGTGGVRDYAASDTDIAAITNQHYVDADFSGPNLIAANQTASWEGDPHFYDADGTGKNHDWDFQGIAGNTYNYINDTNFLMDATHVASENGTVVGSASITLNGPNSDSTIAFDAKGIPTIDGTSMEAGKTYDTADGGSAIYSNDSKTLTVKTSEGYTVTLANRGGNYLDGAVQSGPGGVASDGRNPTGVLGSQFDADSDINNTDKQDNTKFDVTGQTTQANTTDKTYKVEVDRIKSVIDGFQAKLDTLNGSTEMAQTDLSTLTSQRKLAFETLSSMISKVADASSSIVRNIK